MTLLDVQRRMVEVGRIRAGDKAPNGAPRKLETWRLTSKDYLRIERAAELWGGTPRAWDGHAGEHELVTETNALPIMLLPGQLPVSWYELWSKGGCQRRCDGQHELISDQSCLCGEDRECKPMTRLSVLLPDLPGIGSWMLSSTGWNAAAELAGAADILQRASAQGVLIPARLRLEQRTSVKAGQTRRFAVPVLDIDVSFTDLLGGAAVSLPSPSALPAGYKPISGELANPVTLEQGLEIAATQEVVRRTKGQTPIPATDAEDFGGAVAVDIEQAPAPEAPGLKYITERQRKRLFAIAKSVEMDNGELKEFVQTYTGQESTSAIPVDAYEALCAAVEAEGTT